MTDQVFRNRTCWLLCLLLAVNGCYRRPSIQAKNETRDRQEASSTSFEPACDNAAIDVAYVAERKCAECHEEIARQYASHPMGNSLFSADDIVNQNNNVSPEAFGADHRSEFSTNSFRYSATMDQGKLVHSRSLLPSDSDTREVRESHEVAFVVGSGQRGRSYLIRDQDHLFMSPLTWYPKKMIWDLSPGYEHNDLGFSRPVLDDCLFCHANQASLVADQKNQYNSPPFRGHAIGCQRCHGPGQLHVHKHEGSETSAIADNGASYDRSIANPAHMQPAEREAVCQQCHLAGAARIERAGKSRYDFRPGLPLENTLATFVLNPSLPQNTNNFVGQVEQMYASRCFTESKGDMGCISCHDPHASPSADDRVSFYRERCLRCHTASSCVLPTAERLDNNKLDNCIKCHMPSLETDVRHASTTDHRVPRFADVRKQNARHATSSTVDRSPIIAFPPRKTGIATQTREFAMAMLETQQYHPNSITPRQLQEVAGPFSRYVAQNRSDVPAREALADLLNGTGHPRAGEHYQAVLKLRPVREHASVMLANSLLNRGEHETALERWKQNVERHPSVPAYLAKLCEAYEVSARWRELDETAKQGTERFPTTEEFWQYLAKSSLVLEDLQTAIQCIEKLVRFQPAHEQAIRAWFDDLKRGR